MKNNHSNLIEQIAEYSLWVYEKLNKNLEILINENIVLYDRIGAWWSYYQVFGLK